MSRFARHCFYREYKGKGGDGGKSEWKKGVFCNYFTGVKKFGHKETLINEGFSFFMSATSAKKKYRTWTTTPRNVEI